ncbi:MAG: hypothetical protein JZU65_16630 [Chlorobium sp.]|nr:hypothetical protein [Chlorobium sp.]
MQAEPIRPSISIITAFIGSLNELQALALNLSTFNYTGLKWIVVDGNKYDRELEFYKVFGKCEGCYIYLHLPYSTIYQAINRGVISAKTDYYVVAGNDDLFEEIFASVLLESIKWDADVYAFEATTKKTSVDGKWWLGFWHIITSHSGCTIIKKSMHQYVGYYSDRFDICADADLLIRAYKSGFKFVYDKRVIANVGRCGVSTQRLIKSSIENFRIQVELGSNAVFQALLLVYRLLRACYVIATR